MTAQKDTTTVLDPATLAHAFTLGILGVEKANRLFAQDWTEDQARRYGAMWRNDANELARNLELERKHTRAIINTREAWQKLNIPT